MRITSNLAVVLTILTILTRTTLTQVPYKTFTGSTPNNFLDLGPRNAGEQLKMIVTYNAPSVSIGAVVYFFTQGAFTPLSVPPVFGNGNSVTTVVLEADGRYGCFVASGDDGIYQYRVDVYVNGGLVRTRTGLVNGFFEYPFHRLTITNPCKLKITLIFNGPPTMLGSIGLANTETVIAFSESNTLQYTFTQVGIYYVFLEPVHEDTRRRLLFSVFPQPMSYVLTLYTYCQNYCLSLFQTSPPPPCTSTCGNSILEPGEQCDNGNKPGCNRCIITEDYTCAGNLGGSSLCDKIARCGDGVVDKGEQCDNGNRIGCTQGCKVDQGYSCSKEIGVSSACGLCGNGVVEVGEECDNGNGVGCSSGCKVDAGFECRGVANSVCSRKNPVCGNNIIEIGEACDDGNTNFGDGCTKFCTIQQGYSCAGELGSSSKCQRGTTSQAVCGNAIFEIGEQCDNGNKEGCVNCVIQSGYSCISNYQLPSSCFPKVIIPHCGNGVFEPATGEICDDGNVANGDGCNSFCQIESGWICIDNKKCVNTQDPLVRGFCGNGRVQRQYSETCDDGNKINGDGCSSLCKVEQGWNCIISGEISRCSKTGPSSFCGNGIVEVGQTCDDGFPLKAGDGCSTSCQTEPGWTCTIAGCFRV